MSRCTTSKRNKPTAAQQSLADDVVATTPSTTPANCQPTDRCDYCLGSIDPIFISCKQCPTLNLCLTCFSCGAESNGHSRTHPYTVRVKSNEGLSVFADPEGWTLNEEINLLRAVEQFGYGNWDDISQFIKTRTAKQCRAHFDVYFIHGPLEAVRDVDKCCLKAMDHTGGTTCDASVVLPPIFVSDEDKKTIGFLPLRDDYEREYKNDIERLLNGLTINDDDLDHIKESKRQVLVLYLGVLKERSLLKQHARDHGLLSFGLSYLLPSNRATSSSNRPHRMESIIVQENDSNQASPLKRARRVTTDSLTNVSAPVGSVVVGTNGGDCKDVMPSRRGRKPKAKNCDFFESNAKAQTASSAMAGGWFPGDSLAVLQSSFRILRRRSRRMNRQRAGKHVDDEDISSISESSDSSDGSNSESLSIGASFKTEPVELDRFGYAPENISSAHLYRAGGLDPCGVPFSGHYGDSTCSVVCSGGRPGSKRAKQRVKAGGKDIGDGELHNTSIGYVANRTRSSRGGHPAILSTTTTTSASGGGGVGGKQRFQHLVKYEWLTDDEKKALAQHYNNNQ